MIHLHRGLALLLTREPGNSDDQWLEQLDKAEGDLQMVLVEGVELALRPLCPHCLRGQEEWNLPAGAGLLLCAFCTLPFVALNFPGLSKHGTWFTFPWGKARG